MVKKIMKFLHLKLIDEYNSGKARVELLCSCHLKTVFFFFFFDRIKKQFLLETTVVKICISMRFSKLLLKKKNLYFTSL
jgi:hypothetical protein